MWIDGRPRATLGVTAAEIELSKEALVYCTRVRLSVWEPLGEYAGVFLEGDLPFVV